VIGAAVDLATCTTELLGVQEDAKANTVSPDRLPHAGEAAIAQSNFIANVVCPDAASESVVRDRIEQKLTGDGLTIALQPIFSLPHREIVKVEALARFAGPPVRGPDRWFAEAASVGLGVELELTAIEHALSILPELPEPLRMSVNAAPGTFCSRELLGLLEESAPDRVIVELTEHVGIEDHPGLHRACQELRRLGADVAIDDTGTGFASLSMVLEVAPDFIKLDRYLISGIDFDPVRRALAGALVTFGNETGAEIIAEGIETADELEVLIDLGVAYAQGYFLGGPGTLEDLTALFESSLQQHSVHA
jgi:EAL domain-containing protein (putative c-di-GMP-specific phosphodiesterase class I)